MEQPALESILGDILLIQARDLIYNQILKEIPNYRLTGNEECGLMAYAINSNEVMVVVSDYPVRRFIHFKENNGDVIFQAWSKRGIRAKWRKNTDYKLR